MHAIPKRWLSFGCSMYILSWDLQAGQQMVKESKGQDKKSTEDPNVSNRAQEIWQRNSCHSATSKRTQDPAQSQLKKCKWINLKKWNPKGSHKGQDPNRHKRWNKPVHNCSQAQAEWDEKGHAPKSRSKSLRHKDRLQIGNTSVMSSQEGS
jgi:hypothetical protein